MDKEQKKQRTSKNTESTGQNSVEEKKNFNAGGNDSDYDGGHPEDALSKQQKEKQQKQQTGDSYNAGGNDSDYDGGHPEDVKPDSKGRIGSEDEN
ncbi:hypothetical protein [Planococcus sp. 4-30]|uniref:hypothetical protein n=1 Tax=Planococcus sp. 4-30 TaxID=2874583 RepID=UPI001CC140B7|nr:hypothetical protein [Planococcus sp. 4-30]